jgi:hypothetical protein
MYRSKGGLQTPVWEKEAVPGPGDESINFNRSGIMAFNYSEGQVYQQSTCRNLVAATSKVQNTMDANDF